LKKQVQLSYLYCLKILLD